MQHDCGAGARWATEQAIADRDGISYRQHCSLIRASKVDAITANCPLESDDPDLVDDRGIGNEEVPVADLVGTKLSDFQQHED